MKTKRLLSLVLAIIIAVSMTATLGISASAGNAATWEKVEKYGKTFWCLSSKTDHSEGEYDEYWRCNDCYWNGGIGTVGTFYYDKDGEDWVSSGPCEHIVEYEPLTSIKMKPDSAKADYVVGDTLDLTGAKITATTISETTEDVDITSSMVSGFDSSTAGKKTVTVTYRNCTTTFDVTVSPKNECTLDLDSATTEILDSKDLDQNYNLAVNETGYADITKVKLTWEISDINATRTDNKVWDTEELCWKTDSSSTVFDQKGTAKFTLENYSSVQVDAKVTFDTAEYATGKKFTAPTLAFDEDDDETTEDDGVITLDTAAEDDTYSKANVPTGEIDVTVTPDADDFETLSETTTAKKYGTYTVTIEEHQDECLAAGTKITMADGSLKNIEYITVGEKVLTFNHETGKYEAQAVYLAYAGEGKDYGTELTFCDGTTLTIVGEHDLFEKESMKYVTLTRANAKANIGKQYYNAESGKFVKLTSVKATAPVNYYSLYTKYNYNCIANGMLSVPDDVDVFLNIYRFNDDLSANETQLQKDIATYGIYEYRADAPYSKAEYDMLKIKYVNILVGKGLASNNEIDGAREEYLELR